MCGCLTKVGLPNFQRSKIGPKSTDAIFIGHPQNSAVDRFILKDNFGFGAIREFGDEKFF